MSSRVLRSVDAGDAHAIAWRHAEGEAGSAVIRGARTPGQDSGRAQSPEIASEEAERAFQVRLEAARQQARSEGEAAGAERSHRQLEPVIAGLSAAIHDLARQRPRLRAEAEEDTVKLAVAIAQRVLHREMATDPEAILGLVKAAFAKLNARETHRLRVSPEDAVSLEENRARLELPPGVEIVLDTSLRRGSALFETSRGELDASVDTQLAEIERGLADVMRRRIK
jgi:flagellar assembly protein FliH